MILLQEARVVSFAISLFLTHPSFVLFSPNLVMMNTTSCYVRYSVYPDSFFTFLMFD